MLAKLNWSLYLVLQIQLYCSTVFSGRCNQVWKTTKAIFSWAEGDYLPAPKPSREHRPIVHKKRLRVSEFQFCLRDA